MPTKICSKCKEEKILDLFPRQKTGKLGRRADCKSCSKIYYTQYYNKNIEKEHIRKKKYYEENKDAHKERCKNWELNNPESCKEKLKRWRLKNQPKRTHLQKLREERKRNATPMWLTKDHINEIENYYWLARECETFTGDKYHVDHIVPLQGKNVCGLHVPWNLQVLPADVNMKKGNKL